MSISSRWRLDSLAMSPIIELLAGRGMFEIQVVDVATGNLAYFHWMDEVLN